MPVYSELESEYDIHCDNVNDNLEKYRRVEYTLTEPTEKLKRCLDARALHKGYLDEYMEAQYVEHILLRGRLTSKESHEMLRPFCLAKYVVQSIYLSVLVMDIFFNILDTLVYTLFIFSFLKLIYMIFYYT